MHPVIRLLATLGVLLLCGPAWADGTINTLTAGAALAGTEQVPMFQTANPAVSTTPNAIKTFTSASPTFTGTITTPITGAGAQCVQASAGGVLSGTGSACGAGGGGTPGGVNTDVQFNNAGAFGGDGGFTYAGNGQATLALGTITTNLKALSITGTWNAAGVTFDAPLFMNITNTASAGGSLLADLQVGGTTKFTVNSAGTVTNGSGGVSITNDNGGGTVFDGSGFPVMRFGNPNDSVTVPNIGFGSGGGVLGTADTFLTRDAANILAQRNSTSAQVFRVYNTFTDASNYERGVIDWTTTSNTLSIGAQAAGTGTARDLAFIVGSHTPISTLFGGLNIFLNGDTQIAGGKRLNLDSILFNTSAGSLTLDMGGSNAVLRISGSLSFAANTPATLASGSTNNYNSGNRSYFQRITANAANSVLTGWISDSGATQNDGQIYLIVNTAAAGTLTLSHQDAGSTATNRFLCSTGTSIVLSPNQSADLVYDVTVGRWLVFKRN
jgi:hypothetical protein